MENIDAHIEQDKRILDDPQTSPQLRRHTQEELFALETYKANHPDDDHDPTSLELFVIAIQVLWNVEYMMTE